MSDPMNPYASPLVEETLAPGAQWVREMSPSLRRTGLGLSIEYYAILLSILSFLGMGVAVGTRSLPAMGIAGFAILAAALIGFIGLLVCLAVPAESGAKGFLLGSVVFQLANVGYAIITQFVPVTSPVLNGVLQLLGLVGFVLFTLFMKKLSEFIGRTDLAQKARNVLIGMVILIGIAVVAVAGMAAAGTATAGAAAGMAAVALLMFVVLIGGLVLFVMYANLVNWLGKALRKV